MILKEIHHQLNPTQAHVDVARRARINGKDHIHNGPWKIWSKFDPGHLKINIIRVDLLPQMVPKCAIQSWNIFLQYFLIPMILVWLTTRHSFWKNSTRWTIVVHWLLHVFENMDFQNTICCRLQFFRPRFETNRFYGMLKWENMLNATAKIWSCIGWTGNTTNQWV